MGRPATISLVMPRMLPPGEPDRLGKTLEALSTHVAQAAQLGSDLVAFPEICNTDGAADPWQFEPLDGPTVTAMRQAARDHGLYVVCPLATLEDGRRYNSSVLIGRDGAVVGVYHKNFPTHGELDKGIIPGTEAPVFETDFGRVGLCICFDWNYWEVGSALCAGRAELVIWSGMWPGGRMLTRWAIEFGFNIGAVSCWDRLSFVDLAGREVAGVDARTFATGRAPLLTATLDLDRRLLHHDYNLDRLKALYERRGPAAAYAEHIPSECLLIFGSQLPGVSSDELIAEFGLETMRDYLARARRDRKLALEGRYRPQG